MKLIKKKLSIFSAIFILSTFFAGLHAMDASANYLPLIEKIEFEQDKKKLYDCIQDFFNQKPKSVENAKLLWNMYLNFISPQYNVLVKEGSIELKNRITLTEDFTKFSLYCENVIQKPLSEPIQKAELSEKSGFLATVSEKTLSNILTSEVAINLAIKALVNNIEEKCEKKFAGTDLTEAKEFLKALTAFLKYSFEQDPSAQQSQEEKIAQLCKQLLNGFEKSFGLIEGEIAPQLRTFIKANKGILADIFQTLKNLSGLAAISLEKKKELMENVTSVSANILKIVMNDVFDTKLHSASGVIKQDINEIIHQGLTNIVLYGAVGACSTYSLIDGLKRKDVSSVLLTTVTGLSCLALTRYRKPVLNNINEGLLVAYLELLKGLQKVLPVRFRPSNETIKKAEDLNTSMRRSGKKTDNISRSRKSSFEVAS